MAKKLNEQTGNPAKASRALESLLKEYPELRSRMRAISETDPQYKAVQIVFQHLPDLLEQSPADLRNNRAFPKMLMAFALGAFDSAISHAWNMTIAALRDNIRRSDLHLINVHMEESEMTDAHILSLCRTMDLIDDATSFKLKQCLEMRNKFSTAHNAIGELNAYDCLAFISNSCCRTPQHSDQKKAVDVKALMKALEDESLTPAKLDAWAQQVQGTFENQRSFILMSLYGIYCDSNKPLTTRKAARRLAARLFRHFDRQVLSDIQDAHQNYELQGDEESLQASRWFYVYTGMAGQLKETERSRMYQEALDDLQRAHGAYSNHQLEVRPASTLSTLSSTFEVPDHLVKQYVETVLTCAVGDPNGVSPAAEPLYRRMVHKFSPDQIRLTSALVTSNSVVGQRIRKFSQCGRQFQAVLDWLDRESTPDDLAKVFDKWQKISFDNPAN